MTPRVCFYTQEELLLLHAPDAPVTILLLLFMACIVSFQ